MTRPKYKVRVETTPTKENANEIRKHGIKTLEEAGIRVFMTKEEWDIETD
jgi:hypothetical protein